MWGAPSEGCGGTCQGAEGEKRACVVARGEVPRVLREAGNRGVRALRLGGGGQEVGGREWKVNSEEAGVVGAGWEGGGPGRGRSLAGGCGHPGGLEGAVWAASGHLGGPPWTTKDSWKVVPSLGRHRGTVSPF